MIYAKEVPVSGRASPRCMIDFRSPVQWSPRCGHHAYGNGCIWINLTRAHLPLR
jgi:hypothetical protein